MTTLTFDDYTASAPHASPQWASSDRGWLYRGEDCIGFYLAYDALPGYREAFVLAVAYDRAHHQTWRRHTDCASVAEAKHWLLTQHTPRPHPWHGERCPACWEQYVLTQALLAEVRAEEQEEN